MLLKTIVKGVFVLLTPIGAPGHIGADQPGATKPSLGAGPPRLHVEHKSPVTHLTWSPDGKWVATGTGQGAIRIIDIASGKEIQSFTAGNTAGEFAFSPDGKKLAVLERGLAAGVWDVNTGKREQNNGGAVTPNKAEHVAFTADGQAIVGVGVGSLYQWKGFSSSAMGAGAAAGFAAIAPDGSVCGWCNPNGQCLFSTYNPNSPRIQLTAIQVGAARCIAFGPGGKLLAVGGSEKEIRLWDVATKKPTAKLAGLEKPATQLAFSADGKTLAAVAGDGNSIRVFDLTRTSTRCLINHNLGQVGSLALSPNGKMLATTAKDGKSLYVWSASARLLSRAEPALELSMKEMASLWAELATTDYPKADAAWRKLGQAGDNAIPFLRGQMRAIAVPAADMKRIDTLVGELNAQKFATREQATAELLAVGELAVVPLQRVLEKPPSEESRERAGLLLKKISEPRLTPDRQRVLDAIELLEQEGTDKARGLLEEIANDGLIPQIRLQARQALERMRR